VIRRSLLVWLFFMSLIVHAQSMKDMESALRNAYVGKVIRLRQFAQADHQRYDQEGKPLDDLVVGYWGFFSHVKVDQIKLRENHMQIEGRRVYVDLDSAANATPYVLTTNVVSIDITLLSSPKQADLMALLGKVLIHNDEDLLSYLPEDEKHSYQSTKVPPFIECIDSDNFVFIPVISEKTNGSKRVKGANPVYPQAAREQRLQGTVKFAAIIGKEGNIQSLLLIQSAGKILDEAAHDAVHTWIYEPILINGRIMTVRTVITVHFNMR